MKQLSEVPTFAEQGMNEPSVTLSGVFIRAKLLSSGTVKVGEMHQISPSSQSPSRPFVLLFG